MKPIPAIVEKAIDIDLIAEQIIVAVAGERDACSQVRRYEGQLESARGAAKARRLEIGRLLARARIAWPDRGPKAKGWGEFLARVGIVEATARLYMGEYRDPTGFAERKARAGDREVEPDEPPDDDTGPRIQTPRDPSADPPPFRQLTEAELLQAIARLAPEARKRVLRAGKANVAGGSGETDRGKWCTSKPWAIAVGPWDHDPFSNPRSQIASVTRCMIEDGGDGFGGACAAPGSYLTGNGHGLAPASGIADASTRVWLQPPYETGFVERVIAHYGHTRFCALLRWSPDTEWFARLWPLIAVVCHPFGARMDFDPPPGVEKSGDMPFPHALYYADERDVTAEVRAKCLVWPIDHTLDTLDRAQPALQIVR